MKWALVIVDVQLDFCEGGSLAVAGGNMVARRIARYVEKFSPDVVVKTRDFHDPYSDNDGHFAPEGAEPNYVTTWPRHCVIGTEGVRLHPEVARIPGRLFSKGYQANDYSGFQGRACNESLDVYLKKHDVECLEIVGIAGDFCVRATALDAVDRGYCVRLIPHMIASVGGTIATDKVVKEVDELRRST